MHPSTITKQDINAVPHKPRIPKWKRSTALVSRWLHIYLSMVSFVLLFFFAVTGLTLNHQDWFAKQEKTTQYKGTIDKAWLGQNVDKLNIVEYLRSHYKISGAVSEFRVEDGQCSVSFKGPGYAADAFIDRSSGHFDVTETKMGFAAILNDLHKGRDSGHAWSVLIDVAAVFMTFVSITGLVLLCFLAKRRFSGFTAAAVGALLCYFVYRLWVP